MNVKDFNPYLGHKDDVIRSYMELARGVAERFRWAASRAAHIDFHDIVSEAYIGLIRAFNNFDGRIPRFETYAVLMMQWEIHKFIRRKGQPIAIPRRAYALIGIILRNHLQHYPAAKIADEIGYSEIEVAYALKCLRENRAISLDQSISSPQEDEAGFHLIDFVGHTPDLTGVHVGEFLRALEPAERRFVHMRAAGEQTNDSEMSDAVRNKLMAYMGLIERDVETMSVELTRETFLELKQQGKSDDAIAEQFRIGKTAIYNRKKKWGLIGQVPKVEPASEPADPTDLVESAVYWKSKYHGLLETSADDESKIKRLNQELQLLKGLLKLYL